jgi:hypothetical protein
MADALKAEGNKLFAAKKFEESMYVPHSRNRTTATDRAQ